MSSTRPYARPVTLVLGGLTLVTVLAAAGCGVPLNTLEDGLRQSDPITEIRIAGGSGDVTVIGDSTVGVDVRRRARYGPTKPGQTMSVSGGTLTLNTECGNRCSVSYEVHVARGVKVTGENDSGNLTLRDVSDVDIRLDSGNVTVERATGSVSVNADSGNVELTDVGGSLSVTVSSGNIKAERLAGSTIGLATDSGNIEATLDGSADLTAKADSGDITVRLPENCCQVTTSVGSGREDVRVGSNPSSQFRVDLRTGSGNVTVRAA